MPGRRLRARRRVEITRSFAASDAHAEPRLDRDEQRVGLVVAVVLAGRLERHHAADLPGQAARRCSPASGTCRSPVATCPRSGPGGRSVRSGRTAARRSSSSRTTTGAPRQLGPGEEPTAEQRAALDVHEAVVGAEDRDGLGALALVLHPLEQLDPHAGVARSRGCARMRSASVVASTGRMRTS